ncbi:serine/threonine-protein kinase [Cupriavidus pampae]|uniref:Serine/threonine-protein kinase PknD n=1 Tax=Cupriavidus pampae TaxID=659251 RepID=A0ABN7Y9W3_9BURK|nr:serine/threonine-protein kinase [Cupriavidus pampae]CAG9169021.1 Serine/threonine-protein kinase PknD [Cupriavidus pampae]
MPSLADLIRSFRSGGVTRDEFLASIDHALEDETTPGHFARVLSEEHTRTPLPANVYTEVMRRIESRVATQYDPIAEETRAGDGSAPSAPSSLSSPSSISSLSTPSSPSSPSSPTSPSVPGIAGAHVKGVGDTLNGRFVLEECLGVGGMGTVYKALDLRKLEASDRKPYIAIKVLNLQFSAHPKSLMALQREARKAQQLAHRNIVTVYDFDRDGATVFLTMEYLSGKSLSRVLRAPGFAGLPYAKALPIIIGMGRALAYAHERGFVHCDFKPANVFLTDRGEVKVIDFGIARGFRQPIDDADQTVFDAGSLGGMTPAYASPEMFEHLEPDPRDDIYALACVTYELLTGKHPYDRLGANQARAANLKPVQPKVLSRSQWKVLRQALSLDRATRTPTVARFLEGLGAEPQHAGMRAPLLAGAAVGALLVAGVGYYAWRTGVAPRESGQDPGRSVVASAPSAISPPASASTSSTNGEVASAPASSAAEATAARAPATAPLSMANVTPVLAAVPCSLLSARIEGSILYVNGYVSESVGVKPLREKLNAVPGAGSVKLDLQPLGDDKCDVVKLVAPYWSASASRQDAATLRARGGNTRLTEGMPLVMELSTPPHESYVYVDYYVVDGKVAHLVPSKRVQGNQAPASYHATIGDGGDWIVSKPFGSELVVLLTTPAPLFETRRPEFETRQDYLRALEKPLAQMAGKYGKDRISADLVQISTRAR